MENIVTTANNVTIRRREQYIERDPARVICRLHMPGGNPARADKIINRVTSLGEEEIEELLDEIISDFYERHKDSERIFERHFDNVDRKSTRLNSSHVAIAYAVSCLTKKRIGGDL